MSSDATILDANRARHDSTGSGGISDETDIPEETPTVLVGKVTLPHFQGAELHYCPPKSDIDDRYHTFEIYNKREVPSRPDPEHPEIVDTNHLVTIYEFLGKVRFVATLYFENMDLYLDFGTPLPPLQTPPPQLATVAEITDFGVFGEEDREAIASCLMGVVNTAVATKSKRVFMHYKVAEHDPSSYLLYSGEDPYGLQTVALSLAGLKPQKEQTTLRPSLQGKGGFELPADPISGHELVPGAGATRRSYQLSPTSPSGRFFSSLVTGLCGTVE